MTQMRRILDSDGNEFERWLLQSAAGEQPGSAVTAGLRTSLGLSATSMAARASGLSGLKLTLLAVSLGALMGVHGTENQRWLVAAKGTQEISVSEQRGPSTLTDSDTPAQMAAYTDPTPKQVAPSAVTEVKLDSKSKRATRTNERASLIDRSRTNSGPDLREEIRLLDLARNAIQAHQPEQALASLDTYTARFDSGAFKQEASVLRIQALAQRGDVTRASSMAKQFVESNPNSPYVGRAARIAKTSSTPDPTR